LLRRKRWRRGGASAISKITGIARSAIGRGSEELRSEGEPVSSPRRVRRAGGGRKRATEKDPTLLSDLKGLVEPTTRGDPTSPLPWTAKSLRNPAAGLTALGHSVCHNVAAATTLAGLKVRCEIDANAYPKGVEVEGDEMTAVKVRPHDFHGEWNYTISPRTLN
jgi:hypothetical protein